MTNFSDAQWSWIEMGVTLIAIDLLSRLSFLGGLLCSLILPVIWMIVDLVSGSVPPTDEDIDRIMGPGYAQWHRDEEKRRLREKK